MLVFANTELENSLFGSDYVIPIRLFNFVMISFVGPWSRVVVKLLLYSAVKRVLLTIFAEFVVIFVVSWAR